MQASTQHSTHRQVWTLAWLIILADVTVLLLGAVDTKLTSVHGEQ